MTKQRAPLTLEKALVRIADVLPGGFDDMAEATNRQSWLVRAWADPDKREQIPVRDALLLDRACKGAGGGTPIFQFLAGRLGAAGALARAEKAELADHAVTLVRECGEAIAAAFEASQPGATEAVLARAHKEAREAIEELLRSLPMFMGLRAFDDLVANEAHERTFGPKPEAHERAPP